MTAEIQLECGPVFIDNEGNLSIEGQRTKTKRTKTTACYYLKECWEYVVKHIKENLGENGWDNFLKEVRVGYEYWPASHGLFSSFASHPVHKNFGADDLIEVLAEALKYYVAGEYEEPAVAIALAIKDLPFENWENEPQILVEPHEEDFPDGTGVGRVEEHNIMIQDVEISQWEERTNRETSDPVYFTTETSDYRKDHGFDELGPTKIDRVVLEALGVKEEEPGYPDEDSLGLPEIDESGKGVFGLLYESKYRPTEVVVYSIDRSVDDAAWMAKRISGNIGGEYEITIVRRLTPSELEFVAPIEDQPKARVNDWTELEEDWRDRPDDFEG